MSWLLIGVLLVLAMCAVMGHKRGFVRTVIGICSLGIAFFAAAVISPLCSQMLQNNEKIFGYVKEKVENHVEPAKEATKAEQREAIENLNVPRSIKNTLVKYNNKESYEKLKIKSFEDYLIHYLTGIIINAAVFFIIFLLCRILVHVIINSLDLISRLPVLNELNRAAGVFAGIIKGLAVIWLLCIVLTVFAATQIGQIIFAEIEKSTLLTKIYDNNLLLETIMKLF